MIASMGRSLTSMDGSLHGSGSTYMDGSLHQSKSPEWAEFFHVLKLAYMDGILHGSSLLIWMFAPSGSLYLHGQ